MPTHYKAFLVVMVLTVLAFWLARPAFTKFMSNEDFIRRRNLWLILTTCAFLIPSFWLYLGVAGVLIWRAARRDPNPAALYLFLLLLVPPFQAHISGFGVVNRLFNLDHFRLLTLVLIVPTAFRVREMAKEPIGPPLRRGWVAPDAFLLSYVALQVLLVAPYVSVTGSMRSAFLLTLDLLLPYFVLSRFFKSKQMIIEAIAALALAAVVLAPLAIFETAKGWLLYGGIADHWRISADLGYLRRGDILRAQVTSGQSIVLGNFYVVVLGLWLYLQYKLTGWQRWLGTAAVLGALVATFARGPWVGAVVCGFAFFALGPNAKTRVVKAAAVVVLVVAVALMSPYGDRIVAYLPFIGNIETGNITYRVAVNDRLLLLIAQNPLFGSPYFANSMEDLRQGQGIIDILNVYLSVGAAYGLVTLSALVLFLLTAAGKCLKVTRLNRPFDLDTSRLGAALLASLAGTMLIMYTISNYLSIPYLYVGLAALMVAYARIPASAVEPSVQTHYSDGDAVIDPRRPYGLRA
jgi:hypothetical protein